MQLCYKTRCIPEQCAAVLNRVFKDPRAVLCCVDHGVVVDEIGIPFRLNVGAQRTVFPGIGKTIRVKGRPSLLGKQCLIAVRCVPRKPPVNGVRELVPDSILAE